MKDIVLRLRNGNDYYVLEETLYNNKKYLFAVLCDLNNDYFNYDEFVIMEVKLIDDKLVVDEVYNDNIAQVLVRLFKDKIQNNVN